MTPASNATIPEEEQKRNKKERDLRLSATSASELLFVILPFIVIGISLAHKGQLSSIFFIPEWSIVSAVITGQTIVKLASIGVGRVGANREMITLVLSVLLVGLLVPILIVLALTLTTSVVSIALAITQAIFFSLSLFAFWIATWMQAALNAER